MTDQRLEGPGESGHPVPRDLPDQQVQPGEDPWDVAPGVTGGAEGAEDGSGDEKGAASGLPDTDEAGTGPKGERNEGTVHPEHPGADESTA
ncbi:hypothetical protein [Streptomyces minutiscleroticus]|uniref:Uncharacterized protein n=1 Tax=Streptomyces minutiscleroticus TaxID=68238 RepID=A0A918U3V4_9ACTN|nr:hypothetical protein [Streptomyces minutiscleroticus]GGX87680.1 hypothetical protein GCM10010358_47150 [Streptomyces minutiscleroticus]